MQFHQRGDLDKAREIYARVLESAPQHPDALHLYGLACHQQGDHVNAVKYIRLAVDQVPGQPELRNNLGDALCKAGRLEEAVSQLQAALELRPDYAGAHQNLGSVFAHLGQHDLALAHARKAVQLNAGKPEAWFDLGLILLDHVLLSESVEAFRKALRLRPLYPRAATSLIYTLNLLPGQDPVEIAKEHTKIAGTAIRPGARAPLSANANSRTRIGYVSGDFREHAVNYFFEPVLDHHDRDEFEIYCYSDVPYPDHVSQRLQRTSEHWRDISGWGDDRVCQRIRLDRIDILVDLAGHTRHNRLGVFAQKPAPVQVSWLGFPNTTGLKSMDFRIVDHHCPAGSTTYQGTEALIRMPETFACFRPPGNKPVFQPAPLESNGFVTLGCLHKLEKLNPVLIELWAQILRENPLSRLLLARDQLDDWQQQRLQSQFSKHGVDPNRLEMIQLENPKQGFFDLFAKIDLMLDTFPWSGHTLACCALWMGVPVASIRGNSHAGRMVAGVLDLLQLDELVAETPASYARLVHTLCDDHEHLIRYRGELRSRFEQSPLRAEADFTGKLESEYRRILKI